MNMITKHTVLRAHLAEWLATKGNKSARGILARELAQSLHMHVKSIPRSMKRLQMKDTASSREKRGRPVVYGADVRAAFSQLWEAMEYPCAECITRESLDTYVAFSIKERTWCFSDNTTDALIRMSEGTRKNLISSLRKKRGMLRGRSATVSSPLKGMIPIRKSHTWTDLPPGFLQTDSVAHCGDMLTGDVIYSVGVVDVATYWSDHTAQWNKGAEATQESLGTIRDRFPFPWREIHPDTGNEFINYHVHRWATDEGIAMTRSEPHKKNDNMCIEERNNSIARKHLGYVRLDNATLVPRAREILHLACLLSNHFRPVRRMTGKVRIGAKWKRTFEKKACTPYERVLTRNDVSTQEKAVLRAEHETLNPLEIKRRLDILKTELGREIDILSKKKRANR